MQTFTTFTFHKKVMLYLMKFVLQIATQFLSWRIVIKNAVAKKCEHGSRSNIHTPMRHQISHKKMVMSHQDSLRGIVGSIKHFRALFSSASLRTLLFSRKKRSDCESKMFLVLPVSSSIVLIEDFSLSLTTKL